jgi:hypothetical protein
MPNPVNLPEQPIVGIAEIHARDTEHQQPTQMLGQRPNWPTIGQISSVIDAADIASTTGYAGGSLPDHSQSWTDYLTSMWQLLPTGKNAAFSHNPDPTPTVGLLSQDQNMSTVSGEDAWTTLTHNFGRMWRKGAPPATYKQSHP